MDELIKIMAEIELFKGENMRETPIFRGYRPLFDFVGARTKTSGSIELLNISELLPGEKATVQISFIKGIISDDHFKVGATFEFSEGRLPLGKGRILEVLDK